MMRVHHVVSFCTHALVQPHCHLNVAPTGDCAALPNIMSGMLQSAALSLTVGWPRRLSWYHPPCYALAGNGNNTHVVHLPSYTSL